MNVRVRDQAERTKMQTVKDYHFGHDTSARGKGLRTLCGFVAVSTFVFAVYMATSSMKKTTTMQDLLMSNKLDMSSYEIVNKKSIDWKEDIDSFDMKNEKTKTCNEPLKPTLHEIFLAVNFNYPLYDTIPMLVDYYSPVFPHYAICGPKKDKRYKIVLTTSPKNEPGYYSYSCLTKVIQKNPGYVGYLYVNDDMIVNWWSLLNLDKSKIWLGCFPNIENANAIDKPAPNRWWARAKTAERCSKAFRFIEKNRKKRKQMIYYANTEGKDLCLSCWSDIVYIPKQFSSDFVWLSSVFSRYAVFLEAAIPTIVYYLDLTAKHHLINGIYLPEMFGDSKDYLEGNAAWQVYNRQLTFIHPYKLSGHNITNNKKKFNEIVVNFANLLLSSNCLDALDTEKSVPIKSFKWNDKTLMST